MKSLKKLRKPDRDEWLPLLVVMLRSELLEMKRAAHAEELSLAEWARARLVAASKVTP